MCLNDDMLLMRITVLKMLCKDKKSNLFRCKHVHFYNILLIESVIGVRSVVCLDVRVRVSV